MNYKERWGYISLILPFIFFFPLFPNVFGASQIHINLLVLALIFIPFCLYFRIGDYKGLKQLVIYYYFICQLLLFPTLIVDIIYGEIGYGSVFSFLRPVFLCIVYLAIIELVARASIERIMFVIKAIVLVSFLYAVVELFLLDLFSDFVFGLYKREDRVNLLFSSTTFFGTTYYSSFAFFTLALLILGNYERTGKINNIFLFFLACSLVVLTQSKAGMLSLFIALCLMMCVSYFQWLRLGLLFILILFFAILVNINYIFDLLSDFNLVSVKQIYELIYNTDESETLGLRMQQIIYSLDIVNNHLGFFGGGLVPQDGSLESWPALFLYRYGILGVFNFIFFSLLISALSYRALVRKFNVRFSAFAKSGFAWGITLPLTQISTPMMELGKTAFIANFFLAFLTVSLREKIVERKH
ncbi:O-antigen ligase family protein [Grimontia hollisae]|uniref:O-antigen ligase family protein n=1 Tax=Grimontia hollisae TaxID=673 RepID=UPI0013039DD8|nr:O-antigen ligase family protein [Grimontia hollisae]